MANVTLADIIQGGKAYITNNVIKVTKKEVYGLGRCEATFGHLFKAFLITDALERTNTYTVSQQECLQSELLNQIMTSENLQGVVGPEPTPFDPDPPELMPPPHPGTEATTPAGGVVVDIGETNLTIPLFCSVKRNSFKCSGDNNDGQVAHLATVTGGTAPYTYLWSCATDTSLSVAQQGNCSVLNLINPTNSVMVATGIEYYKGYIFKVVITDAVGASCTKTIRYDDKSCHTGVYG